MRTKEKGRIVECLPILVWIIVIAVIVYKIVQKHMMIEGTDYLFHAINAIDILQNGFVGIFRNTSYPIWGLGVKFFERVLRFTLFDAAAWTTVIFYVLNYILVVWVMQKKVMKGYGYGACACVAGVLMTVQPISVFAIKWEIVSGRALINTWHNPTNIVARGLGILSICLLFMIVDYWESNKQYPVRLYIAFGISLIITNLGKPSFSQAFIPAIAIYFIGSCVKNKFTNFFFCLHLALSVIPSLIVMGLQAILAFDGASGGVEIAWFDVMRNTYENIPAMLTSMLAFPISVLLLYWKECYKDKKIHIILLMLTVSFIEYAALAEIGFRRYHGNFSWGFNLSVFYIWMFTLGKFCSTIRNNNARLKKLWCSGVLMLHLLCGISYLWCQLGNSYFWV